MSAIETVKHAVEKLSQSERLELLQWLQEREETQWDEQIAADFDAGKLDQLVQRARVARRENRLRDLR
jgi:hypothetical protein